MPVQGGQQTDRPATETDSTPLGTGVSLDTFLRRDANGHHFESSYPVETKDSAEFGHAWAGAAPFRSPGRTKMEDVGVISCIAARKKSERRRSQEAANAMKFADARKPGPHAPYAAPIPSAGEGPRPAPIIGLDGGEVLQSDTTVQPDGTVVRGDGQPIGKVQPDGTVVGPDGAVLGRMSVPNSAAGDGGAAPPGISPTPANGQAEEDPIEKALMGVGSAIGGAVNGTVEGTKGLVNGTVEGTKDLVKDPVGTIKGGPKKLGSAIMATTLTTVDGTKAAAKKVHEMSSWLGLGLGLADRNRNRNPSPKPNQVHEMSSKALDKTLTALHLPPLSGSQLALVQPDGIVLGPDGKVIGRMGADGNIEYYATGFNPRGLPSVPTPLHSSVLGPGCTVHPDGAIVGPEGTVLGRMNADGTSWSGGDPGGRREAAPLGTSGRRRRRVQPREPEGWRAPTTDRTAHLEPWSKNALPMPPPPEGTPPPAPPPAPPPPPQGAGEEAGEGPTPAEAASPLVDERDAETAPAAQGEAAPREKSDIYAAAAAALPAGGYYGDEEEAPALTKPTALSPTTPAAAPAAVDAAPAGLLGEKPEKEEYEYYDDGEEAAEGGGYAGDGAAPLPAPETGGAPKAPPDRVPATVPATVPGPNAAAPAVEEEQYEYYEGDEEGGGGGGGGGDVAQPASTSLAGGPTPSSALQTGAPALQTGRPTALQAALGEGSQGDGGQQEPPSWMRAAAAADAPKLDPKLDPDGAAPPLGDEYEYYEEEEEEEAAAAAAAAPAAVEPAELAAQLKQLVSPATQEPTTAGPVAAAGAAEEEVEYYEDEDEDEVGGVQAAAPAAAPPPPTAAAPPPPTAQPAGAADASAYEYYGEEEEAAAEAQVGGTSATDMARAEKEIFAGAGDKYEYGGSGAQQKPESSKPGEKLKKIASLKKMGGLFAGKKKPTK